MISIRKIRFILKAQRAGSGSARQIWKLAKVSKATFYRVIRRFEGVKLYKVREALIERGLPGRRPRKIPLEHIQKVIQERVSTKANDKIISMNLKKEGIELSHCKVYEILKNVGLIHMLKEKRKRKKWVRWERKHSLSLWQTDWTEFQGKHLIVFMDDASRLIVGWGLFGSATTEHSVQVLKEAIQKYGKPKAVLTGRDTQFFCTKKEGRSEEGKTYFQKFLEANHIQHILARVNHPQTCGKVERMFGEIKKRILTWKDFETVDETIGWHNTIKPHMSLSTDEELVTPMEAFASKMHHNAKIVKKFREVD